MVIFAAAVLTCCAVTRLVFRLSSGYRRNHLNQNAMDLGTYLGLTCFALELWKSWLSEHINAQHFVFNFLSRYQEQFWARTGVTLRNCSGFWVGWKDFPWIHYWLTISCEVHWIISSASDHLFGQVHCLWISRSITCSAKVKIPFKSLDQTIN